MGKYKISLKGPERRKIPLKRVSHLFIQAGITRCAVIQLDYHTSDAAVKAGVELWVTHRCFQADVTHVKN